MHDLASRCALATAVTAISIGLPAGTMAADATTTFPTRPVRVVAPFPPGGTADFLARLLTDRMTRVWGQQVIVDNRSGAGGIVGTEIVAKAVRDGHTLLMAAIGHAANPALYGKLPYDTLRDFTPVAMIADVPLFVVVNPKVNVSSIKDLIALARAKPDALNFAAGGVGASSHWAGELFRAAAKIEWNTLQYKGGGPALVAVLSNEAQLMFSPMPSSIELVKAGRLRAIAVTSPRRAGMSPEVPTIAEAGVPSYEFQAWYSVLAPAGVPQPILARLNSDFNALLEDPGVRSAMVAEGAEPIGGTLPQIGAFMQREVKKYAAIAKSVGIKAQ